MRTAYGWLLLAACGAASTEPDAARPDAPPSGPGIVVTDRGAVRGARDGAAWAWRGIPYAAPPVGERRWRPPEPAPAWSGVRDAIAWGPGCVEITTRGVLLGGTEDCLSLNVWAPAEADGPLPVLVFLHGGFQLSGSAGHVASGERVYDGAYVAAHGPAVFVSINYRLGAFGYFTGNFGLQDQIAALAWVHDNIAAFGGDPARVLVFGESAGGAATCALYASTHAAGLFSRALIESAGCGAKSAALARELDATLVANLGCAGEPDPVACLRALPADLVAVGAPVDLSDPERGRWGLFVDGDVIPEPPAAVIQRGAQQPVPLVIGTTADEFSTLVSHFLAAPLADDAAYRAAVARFFPTGTAAVLAQYPSAAYPSPTWALIAVMTDAYMTCPTRRIARAAARTGTAPVRRYVFAHTYSNGPLAAYGAGHALDVPFELHNLALAGFVPSAAELALSDAMVGYWVRFAATGDPNGAGAPPWPVYEAATDPAIVFADPITSVAGVRTAACDFWDAFVPASAAAP